MTDAMPAARKGWCPGVLRPMQTGDGFIVRIRPRAGTLSVRDLAAIGALSRRYGNGLIDLTRRANIQLRGLSADALPDLRSALDALGLIDESEAAEAVRNIIVSPLAGLDRSEVLDVRELARDIELSLARRADDLALPGKFGFTIDGGGLLPLDGEAGDVRLRAVDRAGGVRVALGMARPGGVRWLREVVPEAAADAALALAAAFGRAARGVPGARMARLSDADAVAVAAALDGIGTPVGDILPRPGTRSLGVIEAGGRAIAVGMAAPFGRLDADSVAELARGAEAAGVTEFRVAPWRALYAPVANARSAADLAAELMVLAERCAMIVSTDDPLVAIDACPGAPACASTKVNTRAAARALAPYLSRLGCGTAHVSGCSKGCARSKAADVVLVGEDGRFGVIFRGTARDAKVASLRPDRIADLLSVSRTV